MQVQSDNEGGLDKDAEVMEPDAPDSQNGQNLGVNQDRPDNENGPKPVHLENDEELDSSVMKETSGKTAAKRKPESAEVSLTIEGSFLVIWQHPNFLSLVRLVTSIRRQAPPRPHEYREPTLVRLLPPPNPSSFPSLPLMSHVISHAPRRSRKLKQKTFKVFSFKGRELI